MRVERNFIVTAAAGLMFIGLASAADVQARMPIKASMAPARADYDWSGPYFGLNAGGVWGSSSGVTASGVLGGGQVGYDVQISNIVFGLEADIQVTNAKGSGSSAAAGAVITETGKQNYLGTLRGRIGYADDRWLFYATGGWAYTTIRHDGVATGTVVGVYSGSNNLNGYAVGGGVEWAALKYWTLKLEYLYLSFPGYSNIYATTPAVPFPYARQNENLFRAGANYRF